jgi:signal transduction histidine kinase
VQGDRKRLTWAIENLLSNACKYTPQGEINVVLQEIAGQLQLDIHDTGVGIAAADQPYLFSRFFRANENHEATFNVDGVGLGLFITRSLIELHQGQVLFTSRQGEGSTFSIILPIYQPEPLPTETEPQLELA